MILPISISMVQLSLGIYSYWMYPCKWSVEGSWCHLPNGCHESSSYRQCGGCHTHHWEDKHNGDTSKSSLDDIIPEPVQVACQALAQKPPIWRCFKLGTRFLDIGPQRPEARQEGVCGGRHKRVQGSLLNIEEYLSSYNINRIGLSYTNVINLII